MPMQFTVDNGQGTVGNIDTPTFVNQLKQGGYNPTGVSADGMHIQMDDGDGKPYTVPVTDAMKGFGFDVKGMKPQNVDYDHVEPGLRAGVTGLDSDSMRAAYLKGSLQDRGIKDAQVVGAGRDWYAFNPATSQYVALTNSPKWGAGDAVEGGMRALRAAGSTVGGAAGFALGGGSPLSAAGAAAGAGLGGGATDALERLALAAHDPAYERVASEHLGDMAKDVGVGAGIDAATGGALAAAPAAGRALFGSAAGDAVKGALEAGPISTLARSAGKTAEVGGDLAARGAGALDNEVGRTMVSSVMPGMGQVQNLGMALQAPEQAAEFGAKGAYWLGDKFGSEEGNALTRGASGVLQRNADTAEGGIADKIGDLARNRAATYGPPNPRGMGYSTSASDTYRNLGDSLGGQASYLKQSLGSAQSLGDLGESAAGALTGQSRQIAMRRAQLAAMQKYSAQEAPNSGFDAMRQAVGRGQQAAMDVGTNAMGARDMGRAIGGKLGDAAASAAHLGRALDSGANAVSGAAIKTVKWGGNAAKYGGKALNRAGSRYNPQLELHTGRS